MKTNRAVLLLILTFTILGLACYAVWHNRSFCAQKEGRKVLCYQDSMHPWIKSDNPGKCTICGMDLTPILEGEKGFSASGDIVVLCSNNITVLNVRTEEVKRQPLIRTLRVAGTLEANETQKTIVSAPVPCRILSMSVDYAGAEVEKGQNLVFLFSPELVQKIAYFNTAATSLGVKVSNASQPKAGGDFYSGSIIAPQSGVAVERNIYTGQYVLEGEKLFTIVDPSVLWFRFDVYERQLSWLEPGQAIEMTVEAVPGKTFPAVISFIEPTLDNVTRTVKVRADIDNPAVATVTGHKQRLLRFGMYAEGRVRAEVPDVLTIPRTAVLFPGGAAYAYLSKDDGVYERRQLVLGRQGDELWEILEGLDEGDRVVTSGNVLIDAQAQFSQNTQPGRAADTEDGIPAELETSLSQARETAGQVVPAKETAPAGTAGKSDSAKQTPLPAGMQTSPKKNLTYREMDAARMALSKEMRQAAINRSGGQMVAPSAAMSPVAAASTDTVRASQDADAAMKGVQASRNIRNARAVLSQEMQVVRRNSIAKGSGQKIEDVPPLTATQRQVLEVFLAEADGICRALAADNLDQFNKQAARLSTALPLLQKELAQPHPWGALIQSLPNLTEMGAAEDLSEARDLFLSFSMEVVELAKRLRKADPAFAGLKIFECAVDSEPALWMQTKGPLANPFFGAKMPTSGKEIVP